VAADLRLRCTTVATPFGPFTVVVSDEGVLATTTGEPDDLAEAMPAPVRAASLAGVRRDVERYFAKTSRTMRTPVDLALVPGAFARDVLRVTTTIPYGEMWTYGDVAAMAGRPGAARAAGTALARCPIELFVPCHRVVPAGPGLGRYGGSEDRRAQLLRHEDAM
jgi:methylated-DNA-[protein]-cysteine S-methyltransferase